MKKRLLLFFAFVLCGAVLTANAQYTRSGNPEPAVRAGSQVAMSTPTDLIFHEDFEGFKALNVEDDTGIDFPGNGWVIYDEDGDTYNWFIFKTGGFSKVATSASWVGGGVGPVTPENWLVTPAIDLTDHEGVEVFLEYRVFAQDVDWPAENYKVVISTTDNLVASFPDENIVFEETIGADIYFRQLDLSDFAGEMIYIAFVHYDCTDQFRLNLDMIQVFGGDPLSDEAAILEFSFVELPEAVVVMDGFDINVTVAAGTDVTALTPSITVSLGATIADFNPTATIDFTDPVEFVVISENGYIENVYVVTVDIETSVEVPATISDLKAYPNPFSHSINIENADNVSRITVVNLIGQVVMDMPYRGETHITTSQLDKGMYLVVFHTNKGDRVVRRMIKQ